MSDIEKRISKLLTPQASKELDARMEMLFAMHRHELQEHIPLDEPDRDFLYAPFLFRRFSRRSKMFFRICVALAAIVVLAFVPSLFSGRSSGQVVFGQVQSSVDRIQTVSYLTVGTTLSDSPSTDEPRDEMGPPMATRKQLLDRMVFLHSELLGDALHERKRSELNAELKVLQPLVEEGAPSVVALSWTRISGKDRMRTEMILPVGPQAVPLTIFNGREGKHIARDDEQKLVMILKQFVVVDKIETKRHPDLSADFFSDILMIPASNALPLPEKTIDGKTVAGFQVSLSENHITTYWVDPATGLPVRIEAMLRPTSDSPYTEWVMSDFVYDIPLDESLFDVTIPEDYEVHEMQSTFMVAPQ